MNFGVGRPPPPFWNLHLEFFWGDPSLRHEVRRRMLPSARLSWEARYIPLLLAGQAGVESHQPWGRFMKQYVAIDIDI